MIVARRNKQFLLHISDKFVANSYSRLTEQDIAAVGDMRPIAWLAKSRCTLDYQGRDGLTLSKCSVGGTRMTDYH